ncbi:hypothetical protein [uncultured Faecalibaculum sp.]|uniref:hypothetical protein n=1 Tax=uncultured Faecalibaculum sp. TaxID=1729681 RepID=UPI0025EEC8D8|nr:hypothetical protein [uncultured Faecalibaculum sp.]
MTESDKKEFLELVKRAEFVIEWGSATRTEEELRDPEYTGSCLVDIVESLIALLPLLTKLRELLEKEESR